MPPHREFPLRRPVSIVLGVLVTCGFGVGLVLAGGMAIDEARGATVDAEVVGITTNAPGRRVYDVRLVTRSGHVCVTRVDSGGNPPPREIRLGGSSRVHYRGGRPCSDYSVRESTATPAWQLTILMALASAGSLVAVRRLRRTPVDS